jgi:hypothetical protein
MVANRSIADPCCFAVRLHGAPPLLFTSFPSSKPQMFCPFSATYLVVVVGTGVRHSKTRFDAQQLLSRGAGAGWSQGKSQREKRKRKHTFYCLL